MNLRMVGSGSQLLCGIASSPVKLVESSEVVGQDIIISAQIDDIFVTITEQEGYGSSGAIITEPYERRIETLKEVNLSLWNLNSLKRTYETSS